MILFGRLILCDVFVLCVAHFGRIALKMGCRRQPYSLRAARITLTCGGQDLENFWVDWDAKSTVRRGVLRTFWISPKRWILTKSGVWEAKKRKIYGILEWSLCTCFFFNRFSWKTAFWTFKRYRSYKFQMIVLKPSPAPGEEESPSQGSELIFGKAAFLSFLQMIWKFNVYNALLVRYYLVLEVMSGQFDIVPKA